MLRLVDRFNAAAGDAMAWVYLAVFAITVFDVTARYVFDAPSAWGVELAVALCGIHYVLSGAMALQRGDHVRIDVLHTLFPRRLRQLFDVVGGVVVIVVVLVLIWFGWAQAAPAVAVWETTGTAWNSPAPVFMKLAIPLAGVLMLLQALSNLARDLRRLAGSQPDADIPPGSRGPGASLRD